MKIQPSNGLRKFYCSNGILPSCLEIYISLIHLILSCLCVSLPPVSYLFSRSILFTSIVRFSKASFSTVPNICESTTNKHKHLDLPVSFVVSVFDFIAVVFTFQPEFAEPIVNISVAVGRDATFTCHVRHLGGYRVSIFLPYLSFESLTVLCHIYFLSIYACTFSNNWKCIF